MKSSLIFVFFSFIFISLELGSAQIYSEKEKIALKELRSEVNDLFYLDYQKHDRYLITWLRNKKLDVAKAKEALEHTLKFRKENAIENVLDDPEMIDMRKSFPFTSGEAIDKTGVPAYQVTYSKWDIRKIVIAGKREMLKRYIFFVFETNSKAARDNDKSQWIILTDMSNYSVRKHACLACLPLYIDLVETYEKHFGNLKIIIGINTPRVFETIIKIMLPLMSEDTRKILNMLGTDKSEWQKFLLNHFDANQLTSQYGGTKPSKQSIE